MQKNSKNISLNSPIFRPFCSKNPKTRILSLKIYPIPAFRLLKFFHKTWKTWKISLWPIVFNSSPSLTLTHKRKPFHRILVSNWWLHAAVTFCKKIERFHSFIFVKFENHQFRPIMDPFWCKKLHSIFPKI